MPSFKDWYNLQRTLNRLNPDPYDLRHFYDYEKAYKAGVSRGPRGHFPSRFKGAGHPNRFVNGIDTITGEPAKVDDAVKNIQLQLLIEELYRRE